MSSSEHRNAAKQKRLDAMQAGDGAVSDGRSHFLEADIMKTILSVALVLGLCGVARAADEKSQADPVGTWKCEYAIGDLQRTATLAITRDGDKLAGTMTWPDQKD